VESKTYNAKIFISYFEITFIKTSLNNSFILVYFKVILVFYF
jgi:hypothetical protein